MKDANLAVSLVPFVSIILVMALLACGTVFRNVVAVNITGLICVLWAILNMYQGIVAENAMAVIAYAGFVALYAYVTYALRKHLNVPPDVPRDAAVPDQSGFWSQPHGDE